MVDVKEINDKLLNAFATFSFVIVAIPLLLIVGTTAVRGIKAINFEFFLALPSPPGQSGGGIVNAIVGSLVLSVMSMMTSIPIALAVSIYLYKSRSVKVKELIKIANDLLIGTPSIVAGVFI
ncbi:MAG: hypothetical protein JTT16_04170 [Candidatus Brockarchaeota archaeon]|nr:hypothetical protein [Candidatus Brockarchaeota archaeon]